MGRAVYATVVLGDGDTLLGDDWFGAAVIEEFRLQDGLVRVIPVVDVGNGAGEFLFEHSGARDRKRFTLFDITGGENSGPVTFSKLFTHDVSSLKILDIPYQHPFIEVPLDKLEKIKENNCSCHSADCAYSPGHFTGTSTRCQGVCTGNVQKKYWQKTRGSSP